MFRTKKMLIELIEGIKDILIIIRESLVGKYAFNIFSIVIGSNQIENILGTSIPILKPISFGSNFLTLNLEVLIFF